MSRPFHLLGRKLKTFSLTVAKCSNWFSLALAKSGLNDAVETLRFRDGLQLKAIKPLRHTWGQIFEPAIADVYGTRAATPDLIVDVGANIGAFACLAARTHPKATVHAFEPSPLQADRLEENAALNQLENIVLHREAVTKDGRDVVFAHLGAGGSSGIFLHEGGRTTEMKSVSLDCVDFSQSRSLFLKLDCEGAEGEIIEWLCANLPRLPPQIRFACEHHHWCPIPLDQALGMLRSHGFEAEHRTLFDEQYVFAGRG